MFTIIGKRLRIAVLVAILVPGLSWAQVPQEGAETGTTGPRTQLATIIFAGLGGAVLGLSTLSFYGRPQDRLSNIAVGFAVGVIGGFVYTTYRAATKPYQNYQTIPGGVGGPGAVPGAQFQHRDEGGEKIEYPLASLTWRY